MPKVATFTAQMKLEKATANKLRYKEQNPGDGLPPRLESLYVPKWVLQDGEGNAPEIISVDITLNAERVNVEEYLAS